MRDRRYVQDLSIEELEQVLLTRRREERLARLHRLGLSEPAPAVLVDEGVSLPAAGAAATWSHPLVQPAPPPPSPAKLWRDRILLGIEIAAVIGLVVVVIIMLLNIRGLNREWNETRLGAAQADPVLPTATATPLIRASVLPGGHRPPVVQGGEAQPLNAIPSIVIPTPGPSAPTRLVIPGIKVDVPVVEGVDWEQLKKGAGHLIGSANPGERGNCFIAGHNDIYGEIFRDLQNVKIGDEVIIYAGAQPFRYVVRATRIVADDDLSIMYPTSTPVLTLMTCYPYMIDTHRLVVIAELEQ